jgi:NAD(P)-dependent dehydrogenase (short-subunit alcohol dehydrogenase family)
VDDVHFYKCDLSDTSAVEKVCEEIRQTHGEATVLINNAGIGAGKTILEVRLHSTQHLAGHERERFGLNERKVTAKGTAKLDRTIVRTAYDCSLFLELIEVSAAS